MKAIKIILAIAVIVVIGLFVWKWLVKIDNPNTITPPKNLFTARIENEIDSLNKLPTNVFCSKFYKDIQYHIADYHKQGFLGKTENDNDQWKDILSRNLYSVYAPKLAEQAMYVFNGSDWKIENLEFIRSEVKILRNSIFLEQTSTVGSSFNNIQDILAKYDEIVGFIITSNNFSYSYYGLLDRFPDVSEKVKKSRNYLANNLGNPYVNNCIRLKDGLRQIPQALFNKHIGYLHNKIQQNGGKYIEYNYQSDYNNIIYIPLRNQIDALNNDAYGISNNAFNSGYTSLYDQLSEYNRQATNHFYNLNNK